MVTFRAYVASNKIISNDDGEYWDRCDKNGDGENNVDNDGECV